MIEALVGFLIGIPVTVAVGVWILRRPSTSPPVSEPVMTETKKDVVDEAFEVLDKIEEESGLLPPPRRKPLVGVPTEAERTHPKQRVARQVPLPVRQVPSGPHPCQHLGPAPKDLAQECQGLCEHRLQRGRLCYWTPTTASQCQYFELANRLIKKAK